MKGEDQFLSAISAECGFLDKSHIKDIYLGMLRAMGKALRRTGKFEFPGVCSLSVEEYPAKTMRELKTGLLVKIKETKRLKIEPNRGLRDFIKQE